MSWSSRPDLTPAQQFLFLKSNPICAGEGTLRRGGLTWNFRTRPTVLSREYTVRIEFEKNDTPRVFVDDPDLSLLANARPLPHVYHNPMRLCLFLPGSGEWYGFMRIDQTFVPWAVTWLNYFEEWLSSNDWKGGGRHPSPDDAERQNRRLRRSARQFSHLRSIIF